MSSTGTRLARTYQGNNRTITARLRYHGAGLSARIASLEQWQQVEYIMDTVVDTNLVTVGEILGIGELTLLH